MPEDENEVVDDATNGLFCVRWETGENAFSLVVDNNVSDSTNGTEKVKTILRFIAFLDEIKGRA
jgi:hypothetical protein